MTETALQDFPVFAKPVSYSSNLQEAYCYYLKDLPLVEQVRNDAQVQVSERSVPPEVFGAFLSLIFDEWRVHNIDRIRVQI